MLIFLLPHRHVRLGLSQLKNFQVRLLQTDRRLAHKKVPQIQAQTLNSVSGRVIPDQVYGHGGAVETSG